MLLLLTQYLGLTDPTFCIITGEGLESATPGSFSLVMLTQSDLSPTGNPAPFTIQAKNGFNRRVTKGGDQFVISIAVKSEVKRFGTIAKFDYA